MKILFISLIILAPIALCAQKSRSVDLVSGIDYGYRFISVSNQDGIAPIVREQRDKSEISDIKWRLGLNFNQRLSESVVFKTGLRIVQSGYKTRKQKAYWPNQHDGNGGHIEDSLSGYIQTFYTYTFAESVAALRVELSRKKTSTFLEAGICPSLLLSSRVKTIVDNVGNSGYGHNASFQKLQMVAMVSFGVHHDVSETIQLFGQPVFRYHLTRLVDAPISEHLYHVGLEIGVRKKMN